MRVQASCRYRSRPYGMVLLLSIPALQPASQRIKDLAEIEVYYQQILNSYQGRIFAMDACYECRYRVLWGCQGGCLTYALVRHGSSPAGELPQEGMQIDWQEQATLVLSESARLKHYDLPRESYVLRDQKSGTEVDLDASLGPLWESTGRQAYCTADRA